jgi:hypothetical protein
VALIPPKDPSPQQKKAHSALEQRLANLTEISLIRKDQMKQILKLHTRGQQMGADNLDISGIKVAEFLILGKPAGDKIQWQLVSVNSAAVVFSRFLPLAQHRGYKLRSLADALRDKIVTNANIKDQSVPQKVQPLWRVVQGYVKALGQGRQATYRYLGFYHKDGYKHPRQGVKNLVDQTKLFIKVTKKRLIRAQLHYLGMERQGNIIYITFLADKYGKKTKHRFGLMELNDGSLAIIKYDYLK